MSEREETDLEWLERQKRELETYVAAALAADRKWIAGLLTDLYERHWEPKHGSPADFAFAALRLRDALLKGELPPK